MTTVAILGSGFGLYGYLPALAGMPGTRIVLPRRYEAAFEARPELAAFRGKVRWEADEPSAMRAAGMVVMALQPERQAMWLDHCLGLGNVHTLLLEKPLAPTPAAAGELAARLLASGKTWRIGYLFRFMAWARQLQEAARHPDAHAKAGIDIQWGFLAHHFRQPSSTWKQDPARGGGALHFYGIHLIALLAETGYDAVAASRGGSLAGSSAQAWSARFSGHGLVDCTVSVDSRSTSSHFIVTTPAGDEASVLARMADPFEDEAPVAGQDRRVSALARHCGSASDGLPAYDWYQTTLELWRQAEAQSRADAGMGGHAN